MSQRSCTGLSRTPLEKTAKSVMTTVSCSDSSALARSRHGGPIDDGAAAPRSTDLACPQIRVSLCIPSFACRRTALPKPDLKMIQWLTPASSKCLRISRARSPQVPSRQNRLRLTGLSVTCWIFIVLLAQVLLFPSTSLAQTSDSTTHGFLACGNQTYIVDMPLVTAMCLKTETSC